MHETEFADAVLPERSTVLGLPMLVFTIGHEILLWKLRNPLVLLSEEVFLHLPEERKRESLALAVLGCCETSPVFTWLWQKQIKKLSLDEEVLKFRSYRYSGSLDFQTVKMPRTDGVPYHYFGAPEVVRLLLFVSDRRILEMAGVGSAIDFPLGFARMLYLAHLESDGSVWIENEQDAENKKRKEEMKNEPSTLVVGEEACEKLKAELLAKQK